MSEPREPEFDDHPQMSPDEVDNPDMALAFALQTHLCYSYIRPDHVAFRPIRDRLHAVGYGVEHRPAEDAYEQRLIASALKYYGDTMPAYAAAAGLDKDDFALVMKDVAAVRVLAARRLP